MEELILGDFFSLGMVADEDDLYVVVFGTQETHHPEVEAPGDVLLKLAHTAGYIHHGYYHRVGLVANGWFPYFEAQVIRLNILEFGFAFGGVAFQVLHDGTLLVQVSQRAFFAYIGEAHGLGLEFLLAFLFEVGQAEILEDHRGKFVHRDFGFVVVVAGLFTGIALLALAGARLLGDNIAHLAFAIALTRVGLAAWIIAETILIQRADGNAHHLLPIGEDDILFAHNVAEVFLDSLADFLFMTFLVDLPFAMQRPVML